MRRAAMGAGEALADGLGGDADGDGEVGDVLGHHGVRADDGPGADAHAGMITAPWPIQVS